MIRTQLKLRARNPSVDALFTGRCKIFSSTLGMGSMWNPPATDGAWLGVNF